MSVSRSAVSASPILLRASRGTSRIPRYALSRRYPAIAILVPHRRHYATEPSTSSSGPGTNFPPPGFNTEQAKKPLSSEQRQDQSSKHDSSSGPAAQLSDKNRPSAAAADEPAGKPPTKAQDNATLTELAADRTSSANKNEKGVDKKKEETKKMTIWQKVKHEVHHYWDGTKLLGAEVRISFKLALKMAAGYELTRREHRQLQRTVQDLGRLIPFSVFVIVPFAELLLPVALRLFPNMLPSTYEAQKQKDAKASTLRQSRKEVSQFLRQTLRETGLPVSPAVAKREEFVEFFRKVRTTGEQPTQEDVMKVCKIFKDDLTLDNLSRPQLVGICRYMNLNTFGTDAMLRYQIRHRMRQIKRDDKAIDYEGVESLSVPELQGAAGARGLRTQGVSPARLRDDLQMWLDLRLRYNIPSTLLVLSNAFVYAQGKEHEMSTQIDAVQAVLASVPEELFHEIELEVHTAEGAATNKQRLEVLKEQQELIDEENSQSSAEDGASSSVPSDRESIDEDDKPAESGVSAQQAEMLAAEQDTHDADAKEEPPRAGDAQNQQMGEPPAGQAQVEGRDQEQKTKE